MSSQTGPWSSLGWTAESKRAEPIPSDTPLGNLLLSHSTIEFSYFLKALHSTGWPYVLKGY